MSAQQQIVGAAGVGLIVANAWTGPQRAQLAGLAGGSGSTADAHTALKHLGAEAVGVGVLVLLAGGNAQAAGAAAIVLACLWLIFLAKRSGRTVAPGAPTQGAPTTTHASAA